VKQSFGQISWAKALDPIVSRYFNQIERPLQVLDDPDGKDGADLLVVKQRYYTAKTLTILFRDFLNFIESPDALAPSIWSLSIQNLAYLQPHFQQRVLDHQTVQDYE
jgi:hypothetical protein